MGRRQDDPAVGVPLPPQSITPVPGQLARERVCIHVLRLVALAVDGIFQAIVEEITLANGGEFKSTAIKGHARQLNKAQARDDHRNEPAPRPAQNIDINRNACTYDKAADLVRAARALEVRFGTVSLASRAVPCSLTPPSSLKCDIYAR